MTTLPQYIIFLALMVFCGACRREEFSIKPLPLLDVTTTHVFKGKLIHYKILNYKVSGYRDNEQVQRSIANYLAQHPDPQFKMYADYRIMIYLAADESDPEYLKRHPDLFYDHEGVVYEFWWVQGELLTKRKLDDGEEVKDLGEDIALRSIPSIAWPGKKAF